MIKPKCDYCNIELNDFGGTLFSPPDENNMVRKFHICIKCYDLMIPEVKVTTSKETKDLVDKFIL